MQNSDVDIEELTNLFDNINISNMTQPNTNYQLLRLYVDTIPHFDGNPHILPVFLDHCETMIQNFRSANDATLNSFILRAIISKLNGRALSLIGSRIELRSWNEIKSALILCFDDQRNIDCLVQDLIILRPSKNETPYNFGMRCQDARSLIISKINSLDLTKEEKLLRIQNYNELSLKTFIRGLSGQIQNNIRLRNPDSLEQAMSLLIEEENFLYSQNLNNTLNSHNFKPIQRITPGGQNIRTTKPNFSHYNVPSSNFQNVRPSLPNLPQLPQLPQIPQIHQIRNNMPNPVTWKPNNNFPTNKHPYFLQRPSEIRRRNFMPNQNFRPNYNYTQNQNKPIPNQNSNKPAYKPEPMEIGSGLSKFQKPAPQKYTHEELFAQDVEFTNYEEFEDPVNSETQFHPQFNTDYYENLENDTQPNDFDQNAYCQNYENDYELTNNSQNDYNVNFLEANIADKKT